MKYLGVLVFVTVSIVVIAAILILSTLGFSWALAKVSPDLNNGIGLVAGSILSVGCIDFFLRFMSFSRLSDSDNEYADEELEYEEPMVIIPPKFRYAPRTSKPRKKKKR